MSDPIQQVHAPEEHAASRRFVYGYLIDSVLLAAAVALGLALLELILASQDLHWLGGTRTQWRETATTLIAYWMSVTMATFVVSVLIRFATRHAWIDRYVTVLAAFFSAAGFWVLLRRFSGELIEFSVEIVALGALTAFTVVAIAFAAAGIRTVRLFALQTAGLLAGGIAVLRYTAILLAEDSSRADLAAYAAAGWLAVTALFLLLANVIFPRPAHSMRVTVAVAAISFAMPATLYAVPLLRAIGDSPPQPNLLLLTADTLRADDCSIYGGPVPMPALQSLADRGVVIDRFYTTAPWTVPSLCSLFSGRFPISLTPGLDDASREAEETSLHRLYNYWRGASGPTLVAGLRMRGYRTMAVVANPATHAHQWLWQDFDTYQLVDATQYKMYGPYTQAPLFRNALNALFPGTLQKRPIDSTRRVAHYAETLLKNNAHQPFFLWVHFMDPHSPYDPPPALRDTHDRWSMFPPTPEEEAAEPDWPYHITQQDKTFARNQYRAETAYVDEAIGGIMNVVERLKLNDNTYTCVLSDHGEEFWDHGRWGHGQTLFEEQIRVPFVIVGPRIGNGRVQTPISGIDFAPTIAGLLGSAENAGWHGQSFAARLRNPGSTEPPRHIFAQSTQHAMYQEEPLQMVLEGQLKLVRSLDSAFRGLYDLATDPTEQTNLFDQRPEVAKRLLNLLETWSASFPATVQAALGSNATLHTDADVRDAMKAVGYISE